MNTNRELRGIDEIFNGMDDRSGERVKEMNRIRSDITNY
jgi:hypothetical protein